MMLTVGNPWSARIIQVEAYRHTSACFNRIQDSGNGSSSRLLSMADTSVAPPSAMDRRFNLAFWRHPNFRWWVSTLRRHPLASLPALVRSLRATHVLTGRFFPLKVRVSPGQRFTVSRCPGTTCELVGTLSVSDWCGSFLPSSISMAPGAVFRVLGDLEIGPNVHLIMAPGARLSVGGKKALRASGFTADIRVMSERDVAIGFDCIVGWGSVITDSDWHTMVARSRQADVTIHDRVWVAHGVSILKGTCLPEGCVVAAHSLVNSGSFAPRSLIGGCPAKVLRSDVSWDH